MTAVPIRRRAGQRAACLLAAALLLGGPAATAAEDAVAPGALAGRLIVATRALDGSVFARTVILMVAHAADGATGIIVNRPLGTAPLAKLLRDAPRSPPGPSAGDGPTVPLAFGGPVEPSRLIVVHGADFRDATTRDVNAHARVTDSRALIAAMLAGGGPADRVFALGYAGWAPGQLEGEILAGAWQVTTSTRALVFGADHAAKWRRAFRVRDRAL